jgi:hypothetical protein
VNTESQFNDSVTFNSNVSITALNSSSFTVENIIVNETLTTHGTTTMNGDLNISNANLNV